MNILLSIAITTGILSGIWGWVAVSLGLLSWAGFLGCTAYFACPQGGLKGLAISAATLMLLLSFVPGTFIGACATFAGQGDWKLVLPSLALGLVFGYAMKNSGLWLAARSAKTAHREQEIKNKA
ncbi:MAG: DUF1097 domain-containing protein [Escherichia coli]|nr:DUF1097 domain-containing protein [Escherichia coli]